VNRNFIVGVHRGGEGGHNNGNLRGGGAEEQFRKKVGSSKTTSEGVGLDQMGGGWKVMGDHATLKSQKKMKDRLEELARGGKSQLEKKGVEG